jgi:ABC-type branched-subunit amino acid transport system substrate-binding protein
MCVLLASACSSGSSHRASRSKTNVSAGTAGQETTTSITEVSAANAPADGATSSGGGGAGTPRSGGSSTGGGSGGGQTGPGTTPGGPGGAVPGPYTPPVGITKDKINISAIAGFSGSYGPILNTIYDEGFQTWIDDVNASGGIFGRMVVAKKIDNKDTVDGGVTACKQIQSNNSYLAVSIVGFGGADTSSAGCLDRAGITTLGLNLSGWSNSWTHVFSAGDAGKQTRPMATFIKNVIGEHGKIGVIHTNDVLNNAARAALVREMKHLGMNVVHEETVQPNQSSFASELTNMRSSKATTVALIVNTNEVLGILRDAKAIGYSPHWTGNYWPIDETSQAATVAFQGIKAIRNYSGTNTPVFKDYDAKARKYHHDQVPPNSTEMALYGIGLLVGQVLQNAGPTPTKDGLTAAIESLVNYNNGITMGLSFGKGVRIADVSMWPIECCNPDNTWKSIGDAKQQF